MAKVDMSSLREPEKVSSEREKLKPVVQNDRVVSTKKSLGKKFADTFLGENLKDVSRYVFMEKIIPGIKYAALDTLSMMFFGSVVDRDRRSRDYDRASYSSCYKGKTRSERERRRQDRDYDLHRRDVDYQNIVLKYRKDAEDVVDALYERIENAGNASVAELYDLIGMPSQYTDCNWGWDRKKDIGIKRVENGFLIDVAPAEYIRD